jgi:hypothetical protein
MDPIMSYRNQVSLDKHVDWIDEKFPNEKLPQWKIRKFYENIMMKIAQLITKIEFTGFVVDKEKMDENREILKGLLEEKKEAMAKAWGVGTDFDFSSNQKLGILFQKLGWPPAFAEGGTTKAGFFSTSDLCLTEWGDQGRVGISELISFRTLSVFLNTFLGKEDSGWFPLIYFDESEGISKIFHNYIVCGTSTYRHRGVQPNLQQIPAHSKLSKYVSQVIVAPYKYRITKTNGNIVYFKPNEKVNTFNRGEIHAYQIEETDKLDREEVTLKIEKEWLMKLGHLDFASCQVRLCTADTNLNGKIDPILLETYREGSILTDLHTITSHSIFSDKAQVPLYEIEDENGKLWIGDPKQKINTKRGIIRFNELQETDTIIGYVED